MQKTIGRTELVSAMMRETVVTKQQARDCLDAILRTIQNEVSNGNRVAFLGFGVFSTRVTKERIGRNPKTGEEITIPSMNKIVFRPYDDFKNLVNK